jgi:hypothetical protein
MERGMAFNTLHIPAAVFGFLVSSSGDAALAGLWEETTKERNQLHLLGFE